MSWRDDIINSLHIAETTRAGAGAVAITSPRAVVTTTGAAALTLADGVPGQVLFISMRTDGGAGTLTPSNLKKYTTITFNDVGDWVVLEFIGFEWVIQDYKGAVPA